MVVVKNIIRGGKKGGLLAGLGVLVGLMIWVAAASFGVSEILAASRYGYMALRVCGAIYLTWMGISTIRSRRKDIEGIDEKYSIGGAKDRAGHLKRSFSDGLMSDLLNPKIGIFFITFLPSFVPSGYQIGSTTALLGIVFTILTAIYFSILIAISIKLTKWMSKGSIRSRLSIGTGLVLIGFAIRLATE